VISGIYFKIVQMHFKLLTLCISGMCSSMISVCTIPDCCQPVMITMKKYFEILVDLSLLSSHIRDMKRE